MIELWGGFEPTVARVGDTYVNELELTGHYRRPEDIDRVAELGIRTLRYPVLWEITRDWRWSDERLGRLAELGIRPIVGLVHHGSGPPHTSLLAEDFASSLARSQRP